MKSRNYDPFGWCAERLLGGAVIVIFFAVLYLGTWGVLTAIEQWMDWVGEWRVMFFLGLLLGAWCQRLFPVIVSPRGTKTRRNFNSKR